MYGTLISRKGKVFAGVALAAASALVLAGCSTGGGGGDPTTEPTGSADPGTSAPSGEALTLKLGSLLPQTGSLSFLGPPMESGVLLAVEEVNAANAGITIDYTPADEGDTKSKVFETSIESLRGKGITALIGAASSGVSKLILDGNVEAGIMQISPSNTSPDFTAWKDNGLYFRTAPSDLLQGEVLGNLIADDGHATLAVLYQNDAYGSGLDKAITETFEGAGGEVVEHQTFNVGDTQFDAQIQAVVAANPDAVAIVSYEEFKALAPALVSAGITADQMYLVDGNLSNYGADMSIDLTGAQGTRPGPKLEDDFTDRLQAAWTGAGNSEVKDFTYAAEAYDGVILTALAALAAGSTDGADMAAKMAEISGGTGGGEKCTAFAECAALIADGKTIDYDGYSGDVTFDENGDPKGAAIGTYKYEADNLATRTN